VKTPRPGRNGTRKRSSRGKNTPEKKSRGARAPQQGEPTKGKKKGKGEFFFENRPGQDIFSREREGFPAWVMVVEEETT